MVVWWAAIGAAAAADNLAAVVEQVAPSVVRLGVFQGDEQLGNGTGFVVRADGIVATNHHVITDLPGELRAVTRDGKHHAVLGVLAVTALVLWAASRAVRRLEINYSTD